MKNIFPLMIMFFKTLFLIVLEKDKKRKHLGGEREWINKKQRTYWKQANGNKFKIGLTLNK